MILESGLSNRSAESGSGGSVSAFVSVSVSISVSISVSVSVSVSVSTMAGSVSASVSSSRTVQPIAAAVSREIKQKTVAHFFAFIRAPLVCCVLSYNDRVQKNIDVCAVYIPYTNVYIVLYFLAFVKEMGRYPG